jgi:hypothetical protein
MGRDVKMDRSILESVIPPEGKERGDQGSWAEKPKHGMTTADGTDGSENSSDEEPSEAEHTPESAFGLIGCAKRKHHDDEADEDGGCSH